MRNRIPVPLLILASILSGCADDGASTKAGGDAEPVTLRIGTPDGPGTGAADQIDEFVRGVDDLSGGLLQVEPVWQAAGPDQDDWDQQVARLVISGDLDLGMITARAWDTEGVTTMRALHAPFLVTSDDLLDRVVTDAVADEMLAGLDAIGITGLALVPEGLRHVFSFGDPLLSPEDFVGATIRAPTSETTYALFEALGATPDDLGGSSAEPGRPYAIGVADGSVAAAESSFASTVALPADAIATGNVTLFPKVNTIVANAEAFNALSEDQQQALRDAAGATRDWAVANNRDDPDLAEEYCAGGGRIALAADAEIDALREATEVVFEALGRDPATAAMIDRIRELAVDTGPAVGVEACAPDDSDGPRTTGEFSGEFPDGVYRAAIDVEGLVSAGIDRATAVQHAGVWTMEFSGGELIVHDVNASTGESHEDPGVYCVENGRVVLGLLGSPPQCGDFWSGAWTLEGDQLGFTDVESHHGFDLLIETLFGGQPWTKVE